MGKEMIPEAEAAGKELVKLKSEARVAPDNIRQYDMAESLLRKYPKAFGIAQDGSATAAIIQLVKPGTDIPILGRVKSEGIEEAVAQARLPAKALEARKTFEALTERFSVQFANNFLTGEGRGTLSNADLEMSKIAKGLAKDSPAATNLIYAILNREHEKMTLDVNNNFKKYEDEMKAKGVTPKFSEFMRTEGYTKPKDDEDARVRARFPEFFKAEKQSTGKKSPADFMR